MAPPPNTGSYSEWYKTTLPEGWGIPRHIRFLCQLAEEVYEGRYNRLIVTLPPGHAKSSTLTQRAPIYWGLNRPTKKVVFTGYNQTFAEKSLSKPCREIAKELGVLSPYTTAMSEWELKNGAQLLARGVGQPPTGINPIDLLIADDPFKDRAMADSKVRREAMWEWWTGSIVQRFWPETTAMLIMTRWHEEDLVGRLLARNPKAWHFVNLPAIAVEDDPLGRKPGEALWPERKPVDFLNELRKEMGDYHFETTFQGNPIPRTGNFFDVSKLVIIRDAKMPVGLNSCMGIDRAASEDVASDWTAAPIWYGPDRDGKFYVRPWRVQAEPNRRNRLLRQRADVYRPLSIIWRKDPGADGKEVGERGATLFMGHNVEIWPVPGNNKAARADAHAAQISAGNVVIVWDGTDESMEHYIKPWIEEYRQFPRGHDDQVDAGSDAFAKLVESATGYMADAKDDPRTSTAPEPYSEFNPFAYGGQ